LTSRLRRQCTERTQPRCLTNILTRTRTRIHTPTLTPTHIPTHIHKHTCPATSKSRHRPTTIRNVSLTCSPTLTTASLGSGATHTPTQHCNPRADRYRAMLWHPLLLGRRHLSCLLVFRSVSWLATTRHDTRGSSRRRRRTSLHSTPNSDFDNTRSQLNMRLRSTPHRYSRTSWCTTKRRHLQMTMHMTPQSSLVSDLP
jgi:hypothetical protein